MQKPHITLAQQCLIGLLFSCIGVQAQTSWDSLDIQYEIVYQEYGPENILKIRVPTYLEAEDIKQQVDILVKSIADYESRKTGIHIFSDETPRETAIYERSRVFCQYRPGDGYRWRLDRWRSLPVMEPDRRSHLIYDTYLDNLIYAGEMERHEIDLEDFEASIQAIERGVRREVATQFSLTSAEVDSICYHVQQWRNFSEWKAKKK